jgi:uncharacterized BrkB/YihY/UPF0761 family membrane protein
VKEFSDDNITVWAAALTYYGVLSIFPGLLLLVTVLRLFGKDTGAEGHRQRRWCRPRLDRHHRG